ncbi:hypothetical protein HMPREF9946_02481 [Acetobacteraceae bacterium AT-5844]|nr:hypothetical protein HMPREF9946_02481 [Acetobacteraceae bacterium AT-5844]
MMGADLHDRELDALWAQHLEGRDPPPSTLVQFTLAGPRIIVRDGTSRHVWVRESKSTGERRWKKTLILG